MRETGTLRCHFVGRISQVIEDRHRETLGISEAAAKSRLLRAKTVLRASIALKGIIGLKRSIIEL